MTIAIRPPAILAIPELGNGERLTRSEFEPRYQAMPDLKRAEPIEGIAYLPSPVRHSRHNRPYSHLIAWLTCYENATPGLVVRDKGTVRLDQDNEPQPDAYLMILPQCGGQARLSEDDFVEGASELTAVIASGSVSYDSAPNSTPTAATESANTWSGACSTNRSAGWCSLGADGLLKSTVFPGLGLDPNALLSHDLARVLAVLQHRLATPEHAALVKRIGWTEASKPDRGA